MVGHLLPATCRVRVGAGTLRTGIQHGGRQYDVLPGARCADCCPLERAERYLALGYTVYFMMHCPNNQHCPAFARDFHSALRRQLKGKIPDLPAWPMPQQESLF